MNSFNNKHLQINAGRHKIECAHEQAQWPTNLEGHVPDKLAPISINVLYNPALVSLSVIFGTMISEPSTITAAQIGNAALDGSLGTRTF